MTKASVIITRLSITMAQLIIDYFFSLDQPALAIALPSALAAASALTKMLKFYAKVFKTLIFSKSRDGIVYI